MTGTGAELAAAYAREVVAPLLGSAFPSLPVALARLGSGSDVLGLDDLRSRDHDWGLRLTVVVPSEAVDEVDAELERSLPSEFRGRPVRFPVTWDPHEHQRAEAVSLSGLIASRTGLDLDAVLGAPPGAAPTSASDRVTTDAAGPGPSGLVLLDWLSLTGQAALEITAGPVFRDDSGELTAARRALARYPDDVRRWVLASGWQRIGQELPFLGRAAERGDDLGATVIAARLVRTVLHLGFVLEERWAPYSKWLGTQFTALPGVGALRAPLRRALAAHSASDRESALAAALDALARRQAELRLPSLVPATEPFWDRPFRGLRPLPEALRDSITDDRLRVLPLVGVPEQWSDSVDLLVDAGRRRRATAALLGLDAD
ncbi:DUF4037 domain-containing protein [Schumannella luteola]|uniref:DUF4037 domain-containing protein n=1 Tax=Schumannella luteola TaxID=472059 RepID=A0A852YJ29_9MICO|nr:DUF4037 domain-containing protein [Schumannella luteola]NYG99947.1 hypothetical protein [Schumannella luteola]TPX05508.1 DUF4037 domain-containing protein [Schumannella luteola]